MPVFWNGLRGLGLTNGERSEKKKKKRTLRTLHVGQDGMEENVQMYR